MKLYGVLIAMWSVAVSVVVVQAKDLLLERCPTEVQATIRRYAQDGRIDEIESLAIAGRRMFIAEIELPRDRELKIYVLADGALFKLREEMRLQDAPVKIQEAARELTVGGAKLDDLVRITEADGHESYELEIKRKGEKESKILLSPQGDILSRKDKKSKD